MSQERLFVVTLCLADQTVIDVARWASTRSELRRDLKKLYPGSVWTGARVIQRKEQTDESL